MYTRIFLLIVIVAVYCGVRRPAAAAQRTVYSVNVTSDGHDANIGDGVCDSDLTLSGAQCTLRAAVDEANVDPDLDVIGVPAGIYDVSDDAIEVVGGQLEIIGALNGGTILDGTNSDSGILFVRSAATLTAARLTFENGSGGCFPVVGCGMGGAITNHGEVTLSDCVLRNNTVGGNGAAISNGAIMTVEDCIIEDNRAGNTGGGIYTAGYDFESVLTVRNTTIRNNLSGGGGGIYVADADVLLDGVTIEHNAAFGTPSANSYGGGLSVKSSSDPFVVTVQNSVFADNYSEASGGAIFSSNVVNLNNVEFRHNRAAQQGGAIFSQVEPVSINRAVMYGNWAGYSGGAVFQNTDDLSVSNSAIFDNDAARHGGGIFVNASAGASSLENVTISGNTAGADGGGLYLLQDITAQYVTIAGNTASAGAAVALVDSGELRLGSSIIAQHDGATCTDLGGTFTSLGYNVIDDSGDCSITAATGDQLGVDPELGALGDNGGPTRTLTHAIAGDSAAYGNGDPGSCPSFDQRGVQRPYAAGCDSGAFERDPAYSSQPWSPVPPLPLFEYAHYPTPSEGISLVVNKTGDSWAADALPGDGICDTGNGATQQCTLRAAIDESNALAGRDTIVIPSGIYTLTSRTFIEDHTTFVGASPQTTIIGHTSSTQWDVLNIDYSLVVSMQALTLQGAGRFVLNRGSLTLEECIVADNSDTSIFTFYSYADTMPTLDPLPELTVRNCTFRNNSGAANGAAIHAYGPLWIYDSLFENNSAERGGAINATGGAGVNGRGDITVVNSRFAGNSAEQLGGAIYSRWGRVHIDHSIFLNNSVAGGSTPEGGAIAGSSWITVTDSYFENNSAGYDGGAIANGGNWNLDVDAAITTISGSAFVGNDADYGGAVVYQGSGDISHSTFSGNSALSDGGAILIAANSSGVLNSITVVNNVADSDENGTGAGGGLQLSGGLWNQPGAFIVQNSIFAANSAAAGPDCNAVNGNGQSLGGNLIETITACGIVTNDSDLIGVDPQLFALNNVQNHNRVHLPLPGSPAIDSGSGCAAVDQRGIARQHCDRGAAEYTDPYTFIVDNSSAAGDRELGDGICGTDTDVCTFAAAVAEANVFGYHDFVQLPAGTFSSNNIVIRDTDLTVTGAGADQTTLSAATARGASGRVLTIGTALNPSLKVVVQDVALKDGNLPTTLVATLGGGIYNLADLTLNRVLVQNNSAAMGGGIYSKGALKINESAIVDNTARYVDRLDQKGDGGGLLHDSSTPATLTNVTLSGNIAGDSGAGIMHQGSGGLTLKHVTIAANQANTSYGGGIVNAGAGVTKVDNSIIGGNSDAIGDPDCYGAFSVTRDSVLIENNSANCEPSAAVISGSPQLDPLDDYGGPTPTHALQSRSPAIDSANSNCPTVDQRGYGRGSPCDLGAYERGGVPTAVKLSRQHVAQQPIGPALLALLTVVLLSVAGRRLLVRFD